jgi:putative PIG3 family NAD(P)H quinone oxidoreductase
MRAVIAPAPGGPEALQLVERPDLGPPADGHVVLEIIATAVNRADLLQRQGFYPPPPGESDILGLECSGRVLAVGPGVAGWSVGDECCALLGSGGYASQVEAPATQLLPIPAGVSLIEAAALPEVACTVWANVLDAGRLRSGEWLLAHGGASGIGTHATQVAVALGAHVAVTCSGPKRARCAQLGAEVTIDYATEDFVHVVREATGGRGADVILDNMGAKYLQRNVDLLAPDGRLVVIGLQGGTKAELDLSVMLPKRASIHAASLRARPVEQKARVVAGTLRDIWPLISSGLVKPVVDRILPLAEISEAHRIVGDNAHVGKVVLAVEAGSTS